MIIKNRNEIELILQCFNIVFTELHDELETRVGYSEEELIKTRDQFSSVLNSIEFGEIALNQDEFIILSNVLNECLFGIDNSINENKELKILFDRISNTPPRSAGCAVNE